jgi:hypothetical protein
LTRACYIEENRDIATFRLGPMRILTWWVLAGAAAVATWGSSTQAINLEAPITAISPAENGRFGRAIVSADFDGDAIDDLAISSGPSVGIGGYPGLVDVYFTAGAPPRSLFSTQPQNSPSFGQSLASGDVNADGLGDLIIGSPNATVGSAIGGGEVVVYIGPSLTQSVVLRDPLPQSGAQFGVSVAAGDINADGFDEVVVGAWDSNVGSFNRAGEAFVFTAPTLLQVKTLQSPEPQAIGDFGVASAVGDVDGDGFGDVVIGSWAADVTPNGDEGKVFFFRGPNLTTHVRLTHSGAGIRLGRALATGDVSGDGQPDIVAGAHSGVVVFSHMAGDSFASTPLFVAEAGADVDVRDVNGDGHGDVLMGGPGDDSAGLNAGAAWLAFGPGVAAAHPLSKSDLNDSDLLGTAVAFSSFPSGASQRVLVSATGDDGAAIDAGVVLVAYIIDPDHDAVLNDDDNCPFVTNPTQDDTDAGLDNGPLAPDDDVTLPGSPYDTLGDACDPNDDNDAFPDSAEGIFPMPGCASATSATSPLLIDTDGDHLTDKWECDRGSDPTNAESKVPGTIVGDADGDRVPDLWELRGYDASDASADSDADGCHDLVETASIDANRAVGDPDRLAVARRALNIWGANPAQDYVLDMDKNGVVADPDRLFVARAALLSDWLPKSCP